MPRLNAEHLAAAAAAIHTADQVRRDPVVIKAFKQATKDGAQALNSGGEFIREVGSSWRRHSKLNRETGAGE
ncbi:hypothetical protein [Streptomyces sp. NPDC058701]|uniref:hypothetical protein n=1 Tax=Streptomyces sp. NPDC058701 TaxID=3346608 RepID=UPI00365C0BF6